MTLVGLALVCAIGAIIFAGMPVDAGAEARDRIVPAEGLVIYAGSTPTDAEALAVEHFCASFAKITGSRPAVVWGQGPRRSGASLSVGTRATLGPLFQERGWNGLVASSDADVRRQSYVIEARGRQVTVAGYGEQATPRSSLGLSYGLAELIRRLDIRGDVWGFALPPKPLVGTPATPHRLLYTANGIDEMIDAGFDQVVLGHVFTTSMYERSNEQEYANALRTQQEQRRVIELARRRGLEVCMYVLPPWVRPEVLTKHPELQGEGFYNQKPGHGGVCWSKPAARELAKSLTREKMEYFGPTDVYVVWFYDPGGCFCKDCKAHQAENIFDQLTMVDDLARSISPGARVEAVLWPTWCFHEYQTRGIPMTREETEAFVRDFLARCAAKYGSGKLAIVDSCEAENTNIYNGLVDPKIFPRNGFLYSTMGMPGELGYRFPPFGLEYMGKTMARLRTRGLQGATLYTPGAITLTSHAFANVLYEKDADWQSALRSSARAVAKGGAYQPFLDLLARLADVAAAPQPAQKEAALAKAEALWVRLDADPHFCGDRDWFRGYLLAQRYYLEMARAADRPTFDRWLAAYKEKLGKIAPFKEYAAGLSSYLVEQHLLHYWGGPPAYKRTDAGASSKSRKVDPLTGNPVPE